MNPIGTKRGKHKYGAALAGILNLPKRMRFHPNYILLLAIYQAKYAKEHGGKVRILCGRSASDGGSPIPDTWSLAAELDALRQGQVIEIPDDGPAGGTVLRVLRVHLLLISADYLAACGMGPTPESTSALRPCRDCRWLPRCPCARLPAEDAALPGLVHDAECHGCTPRTNEQLALDLQTARCWTGSKAARTKFMSAAGLGKLYYCTEYLGLDSTTDLPIDVMHVFLCGLTRYELAWLTDFLIPTFTTWDKVNAEFQKMRSSKGRKMPYMERPKGDGSRGSVSITLTAAETKDVALARRAAFQIHYDRITNVVLSSLARSLDAFRALLPTEALESAHWHSWVAHVRLLTFCLKHQYSRDDVVAVGTLKDEYLRAFRAVPQYVPWEKPKHHFLEHLAKYLELFGPFRDYWCFPWEAFLQVLKRLFSMTNYKSAPQTVARLWSLKAARGLATGARIAWFEDVLVHAGDLCTDMEQACRESLLLQACRVEQVRASRMLRSILRGPEQITLQGWILVRDGEEAYVARVAEIAQLSLELDTVIRLLCRNCRVVASGSMDAAGQIEVSLDDHATVRLVQLERVCVSALHCVEVGSSLRLRPAL